jgi:tetratricopeptide (TPR) repeat protein
VWVRVDDDLEDEAAGAVARGRSRSAPGPTRSRPVPQNQELDEDSLQADIAKAVGGTRAARFTQRLKDASRAYDAERYGDASRILRQLADQAPGAPAVRELYGLTLYRMQRWRPAVRELEAFQTLSQSTEQHPVLADCFRALRQYDKVDDLWAELRASSPSAELVTEGRIVYAGSLIDRGDVRAAVATLEQGFSFPKRAQVHHLRRAYALADAYERAGEVVRARELFRRIAAEDREFADVVHRVRSLR